MAYIGMVVDQIDKRAWAMHMLMAYIVMTVDEIDKCTWAVYLWRI